MIRRSRVQYTLWPLVEFVPGSPRFNFSAALINSQLVRLQPVGILKVVLFSVCTTGPEKPWLGSVKYVCMYARSWGFAPTQVMVDRCAFVKTLWKSRADSTAKMYPVDIKRFLVWCKQNSFAYRNPFSSTLEISDTSTCHTQFWSWWMPFWNGPTR